jgi:hypothetical protein
MWLVWCLGALVGMCLLLSMLDRPPTERGMRGRRGS